MPNELAGFDNHIRDTKHSVKTAFGEFKQEYLGPVWIEKKDYAEGVDLHFPVGANMYMSFNADENKINDVKEFGFVQQAKSMVTTPVGTFNPYVDTAREAYMEDDKFIDQNPGLKNPLYATDKKFKRGGKRDIAGYKTQDPPIHPSAGKTDTAGGRLHGRVHAGHGGFGSCYMENGSLVKTPAYHQDTPHDLQFDSWDALRYDFETAVLAFSGNASGMYLGSVKWDVDIKKGIQNKNGHDVPKGKIDSTGIVKSTDGKPSASFMKSVQKWNESKSEKGRHKIIELPTGSGKVKADNAFLFPTESDVEGKHKLLNKDAGCMIFERKKLGDGQAEYARVRVDQGGKIMIGWIPTASLNIVQDV